MAPLWKSMLSRSSPLYRESLYSFSLWEWKAQERELLLLKRITDRDRKALLSQLDKLSKELQQKDKVIESLRAKLNQHHNHHHHHRSDTPTSSHAPSDTSDQSDRISYVSDDQGSTNQELEICSEGDAASEMGGKETRSSTRLSTDCLSHSGSHHTSIAPSISSCLSSPSMHCSNNAPHTQADMHSHTAPALSFLPPPPHPPTASLYPPTPRQPSYHGDGGAGFSLAEVHQELQMLQRQLAHSDNRFSTPQSRAVQGYPFSQPPADPSAFLPFSFHGYSGYQPSPFNTGDNGTGIKASGGGGGAGLLESNALWDMTYGSRPMRMGADISSGSSGYQSGTSNTGSDLMKEHLREIRSLRQRLEDSIQTNERLRHQLEDRLARSAEKGAPTNIYIQGLDSVGQLSSEIRLLKEDNLSLHSQLRQAAREGSEEAERGRAKLKEAELQAEQWEELSRKQEAEAGSHNQEITQLKQERQRNQEAINRLQHEALVLQQQLTESRGLVLSLQTEIQAHLRGSAAANTHTAGKASSPLDPLLSTFDPRELQTQLEQQLTGKTTSRRRLFNENVSSPPVRDTGLISPSSPLRHRQAENHDSVLEGSCPDGSFSDRHGRHAVGHMTDFRALQQQIREGGALLGKMDAALVTLTTTTKDYSYQFSLHQSPDYGSCVRKLLSETKTLREVLQEADSLLHMFWRAKLPNGNKDQALREEVVSLRLKLSDRDAALQVAMERVKSSDRTKESMEHFIVNQLSRTRDVLSKAKTNLQENELRISSLHSHSSSVSSSSKPGKVESPGGFCELSFSPGWSVLRPKASSSSAVSVPVRPPHQHPLKVAYM